MRFSVEKKDEEGEYVQVRIGVCGQECKRLCYNYFRIKIEIRV